MFCPSDPVTVSGIDDALELSVGETHACALLSSGTAKCWGNGDAGRLGDNNLASRNTPVEVFGVDNAIQIEAGGDFSCSLIEQNSVRCWGADSFGQLRNDQEHPSVNKVSPPDGSTDIAQNTAISVTFSKTANFTQRPR